MTTIQSLRSLAQSMTKAKETMRRFEPGTQPHGEACDAWVDAKMMFQDALTPALIIALCDVVDDYARVLPSLECQHVHHAKPDRHEYDTRCPVIDRMREQMAKLEEIE